MFPHVGTDPDARSQPEIWSPLKNELPDSSGDNKYTKDMMPGYSGMSSGVARGVRGVRTVPG